jgi:hypothetical protein
MGMSVIQVQSAPLELNELIEAEISVHSFCYKFPDELFNPLNPELNPLC